MRIWELRWSYCQDASLRPTSLVVGELLHKLADTPMVGLPVHHELGELFTSEFCRLSLVQCSRVYLETQADAHQALLNSGDPMLVENPENFMAVGVCKWDETEQHMQLRASGMPNAIPLLRSDLDAKRRGESTQGMAMQTLIQESFLYIVDLMNRCLVTSETLVAPLKHLTGMTAAHLWAALTGPEPIAAFRTTKLLLKLGFMIQETLDKRFERDIWGPSLNLAH